MWRAGFTEVILIYDKSDYMRGISMHSNTGMPDPCKYERLLVDNDESGGQ